MAAKVDRRRRATTHKSAYRLKFAMCAKHCHGDTACMAKCLKKK